MKIRLSIVMLALLVAGPAAAGGAAGNGGLNGVLTDQQEALLGCGPFYGTTCTVTDIGLIGTGASVLLQSWPGTSGSSFPVIPGSGPPGPIGTRFFPGGVVLPGVRGPNGTSFDPVNPFTGQPFDSELAVLSWNALVALVALSTPAQPGTVPMIDAFDPSQPYRSDGCSFARPQNCLAIQEFFASQPGAAVPEPGAALLFGLGAAAVVSATRRRG